MRLCRRLAVLLAALCWGSGVRAEPAPAIRFVEVQREAGLDFRHVHGGSDERYMVETMGAGGGLPTARSGSSTASPTSPAPRSPSNLYRRLHEGR